MINFTNIKSKFKREYFILLFLLLTGLFFRSIHFDLSLNFSAEQGAFSESAYDLYKARKITLIGPPISFRTEGRLLFQGSITYYFQLVFLLLGNFDPIISSYILTLFGILMVIPLYSGVFKLINKKWAFLISIVYLLLPLYIDYTKFFWNPNFQIILFPILILGLGNYKKNEKSVWIYLSGAISGLLLMFHYQFIVVIFILGIYLFLIEKYKFKILVKYLLGAVFGFLPMIAFELKNNFYNLQTILLYLNNWNRLKESGGMGTYHYYLSIGLTFLIIVGRLLKDKLDKKLIYFIFILLVIIDFYRYVPSPSSGFGMINGWNYLDEKKVSEIIMNQKINNFNIVNLPYDTLAQVQKYLLKIDNIVFNKDDYKNNKYLFVINKDNDYMSNPAYEVNEFKPNILLQKWEINNNFNLYLLERLSN